MILENDHRQECLILLKTCLKQRLDLHPPSTTKGVHLRLLAQCEVTPLIRQGILQGQRKV